MQERKHSAPLVVFLVQRIVLRPCRVKVGRILQLSTLRRARRRRGRSTPVCAPSGGVPTWSTKCVYLVRPCLPKFLTCHAARFYRASSIHPATWGNQTTIPCLPSSCADTRKEARMCMPTVLVVCGPKGGQPDAPGAFGATNHADHTARGPGLPHPIRLERTTRRRVGRAAKALCG